MGILIIALSEKELLCPPSPSHDQIAPLQVNAPPTYDLMHTTRANCNHRACLRVQELDRHKENIALSHWTRREPQHIGSFEWSMQQTTDHPLKLILMLVVKIRLMLVMEKWRR